MKLTSKDLIDVLGGMGTTAGEVRETLLASSIRGSRASLRLCPIAEFLSSKGFLISSVRATHITLKCGSVVTVPQPVMDFIIRFDGWSYANVAREDGLGGLGDYLAG